MAHIEISRDGKKRVISGRHYAEWVCVECGHWCGYINHRIHEGVVRKGFCRACDGSTVQEAKKVVEG